jgi:hypothetical protein
MKEFIIVLGMCVASLLFVDSLDYAALRAQHPWATADQLNHMSEFDASHFGSRQAAHAPARGHGCGRPHPSGWARWLKSTEAASQLEIEARQRLACHRAEPALPGSRE